MSADGELPIRGGTLNQIVKRLTNENKPGTLYLFLIMKKCLTFV